jgi:hypothetical protein
MFNCSATLCGLDFLPAVFESTGQMSIDLLRHLTFLSEAAEPEQKISIGIILHNINTSECFYDMRVEEIRNSTKRYRDCLIIY